MSWLSNATGIDINLTGSSKTPTLQQAEMPPIAQEELKNLVSSAKQSPEEFVKQSRANVETGMGMLGGGTPKAFAQTGVQPAQIEAFRNVYGAQTDRKSTRLNSSHIPLSRMPSSA